MLVIDSWTKPYKIVTVVMAWFSDVQHWLRALACPYWLGFGVPGRHEPRHVYDEGCEEQVTPMTGFLPQLF